ncbi:hypothetical protein GOODEAATRI_033958 [Goodea atripinnis]|uniref:Thioredoxin domain-containing protein n=1 Tax=Goodea atripinnis TaxID=208336 RepID=A0ABV0PU33_9TELE
MLKGEVRAGKVDCQAHYQMCQSAGITAYPTVRFYPYRGTKRYEHSGEHINSRDANTIADIIRRRIEQQSSQLHNTPKVTNFSFRTEVQSICSARIRPFLARFVL